MLASHQRFNFKAHVEGDAMDDYVEEWLESSPRSADDEPDDAVEL